MDDFDISVEQLAVYRRLHCEFNENRVLTSTEPITNDCAVGSTLVSLSCSCSLLPGIEGTKDSQNP